MNISQHAFLPTSFQLGFFNRNGVSIITSSKSLTHFFPTSTIGYHLFSTPSTASDIFGRPFVITNSSYSLITSIVPYDGTIADSTYLIPSKPFTYLLY